MVASNCSASALTIKNTVLGSGSSNTFSNLFAAAGSINSGIQISITL